MVKDTKIVIKNKPRYPDGKMIEVKEIWTKIKNKWYRTGFV